MIRSVYRKKYLAENRTLGNLQLQLLVTLTDYLLSDSQRFEQANSQITDAIVCVQPVQENGVIIVLKVAKR